MLSITVTNERESRQSHNEFRLNRLRRKYEKGFTWGISLV